MDNLWQVVVLCWFMEQAIPWGGTPINLGYVCAQQPAAPWPKVHFMARGPRHTSRPTARRPTSQFTYRISMLCNPSKVIVKCKKGFKFVHNLHCFHLLIVLSGSVNRQTYICICSKNLMFVPWAKRDKKIRELQGIETMETAKIRTCAVKYRWQKF